MVAAFSELCFMAWAAERGLNLSKPHAEDFGALYLGAD
jgi:hypothetical protein